MTELHTAPNLAALYGKAALAMIRPGHRSTELPTTELPTTELSTTELSTTELSTTELSRSGVRVDRAHLAAYDRVCGFRLTDTLPPTYPHLLVFGLQMALMTAADFPFPMIGLVHVANRISQRRPLTVAEPLVVRTHAANLRPHERGTQFDLVSEALADGEPVWSETSTYLRRTGASSSPSAVSPNAALSSAISRPPTAVWRLPGDTGRRYAAVSGDRNPIHLHPLTARLFGFRRAIAHGMWTLARCLAFEEGRLPDAYEVDVRFKLPILLPSTVAYVANGVANGVADGVADGAEFELRGHSSGKPHLTGSIRKLATPNV